MGPYADDDLSWIAEHCEDNQCCNVKEAAIRTVEHLEAKCTGHKCVTTRNACRTLSREEVRKIRKHLLDSDSGWWGCPHPECRAVNPPSRGSPSPENCRFYGSPVQEGHTPSLSAVRDWWPCLGCGVMNRNLRQRCRRCASPKRRRRLCGER